MKSMNDYLKLQL